MVDSSIHGVCPIVDTPFDDTGNVDYESLERLSHTLVDKGCHGLALFGYASEFYKLTDDERERMIEIVVEACNEGDIPAVVSVTAQATIPAVEAAKQIEAAGADGLMILPPHTRGPPETEVREHLHTVAEAVSLPVMVQYAPGSTGVTYSPEFFASLYNETDNIDLFKIECDPPGEFISKLHELTDDEADVLVGRAGYEMIEGYDRDAVGVMPASAMYDIYLDIHEQYHAGNRDEAVGLHSELVAVLNQLTKVGIAWEKRVLARRGLITSDHCRSPEANFDETYEALFEEYYERFIAPNIGNRGNQ
jgi:4-hydroxy-tetrahydrodipicolinate synthase